MSHSFTSSLFHCVWSTKERRKSMTPDLQSRLWPYLGGIARQNKMKTLAINGVVDHVHVLLSLPSTMTIAHGIQLLKGGSSKWVHDNFPEHPAFAWQVGYGAFSIGVSQAPMTVAYIENQQEHHSKQSFEDEFLAILRKQEIDYDPKYVWG